MVLRLLLIVLALTSPFVVRADEARPSVVATPVDASLIDDAQDLLYLGRDRPIFVRLHLRVDGDSFRANWRRFAEGMFRKLDQNADGLLAENEWARIPSVDFLILGNTEAAPQGVESVRDTIDRSPSDGLITLDEFADCLIRHGSRAISLQALGSGEGARQLQNTGTPGGAGNRLFSRLDTSGDGALSTRELTDGTQLVSAADFDEDGAMSVNELLSAPTSALRPAAVSTEASSRYSLFVEIPDVGPFDALSRRLIDRYDDPEASPQGRGGGTGDDRLSQKELRLPASIFNDLDHDGDGTLSFEELQGIVRHSRPSLTVTARIGPREGNEPQIEVVKTDPDLVAEVQEAGFGRVLVFMGGDQLDFSVELDTEGARVRESLLQLFKGADRDNNSYLERPESSRTVFAVSFDSMDEDGDGRLFQNEFIAWLERRESAAASRCQMSVASEGRNLFDNLDVNRDGRLTPRELRQAPTRTRPWDINADSRISPDEVPAHFRIVFGRAQPDVSGLASFASPPRARPDSGEKPGSGWFHRMDRNHDGEITRREFLGTRAMFDRYDRNRDGVIEQGEATAE